MDVQARGQFGNAPDFFARDMAVYVPNNYNNENNINSNNNGCVRYCLIVM